MLDATEGQAPVRPGRCANHPGLPRVAGCDVCGRALCLTCATPVRGTVVGPECLASVLDGMVPPADPTRERIPPRGDRLAIVGFGIAVAFSTFRWSRFGDSSHYFGAWAPHWSVVSALAAVAGLLFAVVVWRRPLDPRLETAVYLAVAVVVGAGAIMHHSHPPPLTVPTSAPWVAVAGAALALVGAAAKGASLFSVKRRRRSIR